MLSPNASSAEKAITHTIRMARKQRIKFLLIIFRPSSFFRIGPRLAFLLAIRDMKSLSHILVGGCEIAFNGDTREASASAPPAQYRPLSISHNFLQTITRSIANCCLADFSPPYRFNCLWACSFHFSFHDLRLVLRHDARRTNVAAAAIRSASRSCRATSLSQPMMFA